MSVADCNRLQAVPHAIIAIACLSMLYRFQQAAIGKLDRIRPHHVAAIVAQLAKLNCRPDEALLNRLLKFGASRYFSAQLIGELLEGLNTLLGGEDQGVNDGVSAATAGVARVGLQDHLRVPEHLDSGLRVGASDGEIDAFLNARMNDIGLDVNAEPQHHSASLNGAGCGSQLSEEGIDISDAALHGGTANQGALASGCLHTGPNYQVVQRVVEMPPALWDVLDMAADDGSDSDGDHDQ